MHQSILTGKNIENLNEIINKLLNQEETSESEEEIEGNKIILKLLKEANLPASINYLKKGSLKEEERNAENESISKTVSRKINGGDYKFSSLRNISRNI